MSEPVYDNFFFERHARGSLLSARAILPILFEFCQPRSIIDVGCGTGAWLRAGSELGVTDILGLDGDYVDRGKLLIDEHNFQSRDLVERINLDRRYDLAISVEVAEHLPYERAESLIADLCKLSDVVLFSAALPYQGGTNHVNEQWLEFWGILFRQQGYVACDALRKRIWKRPDVEFWYIQNLVVFCRSDRAAELFPPECIMAEAPLSCVHPLTLIVNTALALGPELEDYLSLLRAYLSGATTLPPLKAPVALVEDGGSQVALFPAARMRFLDVRAQLRACQDEVAARDSRIHSLSAELQAVYSSGSWRITKPLRRLVGWLKSIY